MELESVGIRLNKKKPNIYFKVSLLLLCFSLNANFRPQNARLPNARMLNSCLNIKNNCSMKKIKNQVMPCNSLWIPAFVV